MIGADKKFEVLNYLNIDNKENKRIHSCEINSVDFFKSSFSLGERTRSFLRSKMDVITNVHTVQSH